MALWVLSARAGYAVLAAVILLVVLAGVFFKIVYDIHLWKEKDISQRKKEKIYIMTLIIFIVALFLSVPDIRKITYLLLTDALEELTDFLPWSP